MEIEFPESSYINPPHKVEGSIREAKTSFYRLAEKKLKLMNSKEFKNWQFKIQGKRTLLDRTAGGFIWVKFKKQDGGTVEKFIEKLEIGINVDDFVIDGVSYRDIIPFAIEHELYEAWLNAKKGLMADVFNEEGSNTKHQLALRREFYFAEKAGKGQKVFEWHTKFDPENENEYKNAWEKAKKRINKPM